VLRTVCVLVVGFTLAGQGIVRAESRVAREQAPLRLERGMRSIPVRELVDDRKTGGDSRPYDRHLWRAESRYGIAADLLRAVIRIESNFNPRAKSHAGAKGLMQLMPLTAKTFGVRDVFDPGQNIQAGARYLCELASAFSGDIGLTLAAYHAGPTNVMMRGGALSSPVTRAYVIRVLAEYARLRRMAVTLDRRPPENAARRDQKVSQRRSP
jgi:soluble lytic murein transglycosylase-like protein